jgi:hypothetical protein
MEIIAFSVVLLLLVVVVVVLVTLQEEMEVLVVVVVQTLVQQDLETLHQHHHHKEIRVDLDNLAVLVLVGEEVEHLNLDKQLLVVQLPEMEETEHHLLFLDHQ